MAASWWAAKAQDGKAQPPPPSDCCSSVKRHPPKFAASDKTRRSYPLVTSSVRIVNLADSARLFPTPLG
jgi:hypothetical protein